MSTLLKTRLSRLEKAQLLAEDLAYEIKQQNWQCAASLVESANDKISMLALTQLPCFNVPPNEIAKLGRVLEARM